MYKPKTLLEKLIIKYPSKLILWDWDKLSENPNISIEFIDNNMNLPWNFSCVSENPNLSFDFVKKNISQDWKWSRLSSHDNITPEVIENNKDLPWVWEARRMGSSCVLFNKNITFDFIEKNKDKELDIYILVREDNRLSTSDYIRLSKLFPEYFEFESWDDLWFNEISKKSNIDLNIVVENPEINWDWELISTNPNLTIEFLLRYPDKPWNWKQFSKNPNLKNITLDIIEQNLDKNWNWQCISEFNKLTMDFINKYPDKNWNWYSISSNLNIILDIIVEASSMGGNIYDALKTCTENVSKDLNCCSIFNFLNDCFSINNNNTFDWFEFSHNKNITLDMIDKYSDKEWNWYSLSENPYLSIDFFEKYGNKHVNWEYFSKHPDLSVESIKKIEKKHRINWSQVSKHPNMTMHIIETEEELVKYWNWKQIMDNPNITKEFIIKHIDKFDNIKVDPYSYDDDLNLPIEFIDRNINEFPNWKLISKNHNITEEFIEKYIDNINWKKLSKNTLGWKKDKTLEYYQQRKELTIEKTSIFKDELIEQSWNPERFMGWCLSEDEVKSIKSSFDT